MFLCFLIFFLFDLVFFPRWKIHKKTMFQFSLIGVTESAFDCCALTNRKSNDLKWRFNDSYVIKVYRLKSLFLPFIYTENNDMETERGNRALTPTHAEFKSNINGVIPSDPAAKGGLSKERSALPVCPDSPNAAPNLQRLGWLAPSTVQRHLIPAFVARRGRASLGRDPVPWQDTRGVNYFHWLAVLKQKAPTKTFYSNWLVAFPELPPA